MAQSSVPDFFTALISSFMGEDHLSPVHNLYGFLLNLYSSDAALTLNIATKYLYVAILVSSLIVVFALWKDLKIILIFFLFLVFNVSMTWRNMIHPVPFNIPVLFSLWCLFFMHRFIKGRKQVDLLFFAISFFILTFSFETAFLGIPLLVVYGFLSVWDKQYSFNQNAKDISKIYALMFILFVPYMLIHFKLYGSLLPGSRIEIVRSYLADSSRFDFYVSLFRELLSGWFFGVKVSDFIDDKVFAIVKFPVGLLFIFLVYRFKLMSRVGFYLFAGFLLQLLAILYTARVEAGMWTFGGIVLFMIVADVTCQIISKLGSNNGSLMRTCVFVLIAIPCFAEFNENSYPFEEAYTRYGHPYESSQAAYRAIGQGSDSITVVRLPDASPLMHIDAFWLGNKIYNNEPSLWLYPEYYQLLPTKKSCEYYDNREGLLWSHNFRPFLTTKPGNEKVVIFKDRNSFSRIFLDPDDRTILQTEVIADAPQDYFNLHLPELSNYNRDTSELEITITLLSKPRDIYMIWYHDGFINSWETSGNKITFKTSKQALDPVLDFKSTSRLSLKTIEISFPEDSTIVSGDNISISDSISLVADDNPCMFNITSSKMDLEIRGFLGTAEAISFSPLVSSEIYGSLEMTYWTIETNPDQQMKGKIYLNNLSNEDFPIHICSSIMAYKGVTMQRNEASGDSVL